MTRGVSKRSVAGGLAVLAASAGFLVTPTAATAHTAAPSTPTRLRIAGVSPSSFTVSATGDASTYRLYAAFRRGDLATVNVKKHAVHSHKRTDPTLTLKGLQYTTEPYYYRIEAMNGDRHKFSAIEGTVSLQPATPTDVQATEGTGGTVISWDSAPATGFIVTQASDPGMTTDVQTYTIEHQDHTFSPPGLTQGHQYYFQVQAVNGDTTSPVSSMVTTGSQNDQQPVSVMTYNIRKATSDGRSEGGNVVPPWSQRKAGVAAFINGASPDVVGIEEGAALVADKTRQVDDLRATLDANGDNYDLAETEVPPWEKGHTVRAGTYILYKHSTYEPDGAGGLFLLGDERFAAYQVLKNKATGAEFLFVVPHLQVTGQPGGTDAGREAEDQSMVMQATGYDASRGNLPIVYAGDFNNDPSNAHAFNGPSDYNLSHGMDDAFDVAQTRTNAQYNSANGYQTTPPALGLRIDYIFVTPGISVTHWGLLLNLSHGKFVGTIPSDHNPMVADLLIPFERTS